MDWIFFSTLLFSAQTNFLQDAKQWGNAFISSNVVLLFETLKFNCWKDLSCEQYFNWYVLLFLSLQMVYFCLCCLHFLKFSLTHFWFGLYLYYPGHFFTLLSFTCIDILACFCSKGQMIHFARAFEVKLGQDVFDENTLTPLVFINV